MTKATGFNKTVAIQAKPLNWGFFFFKIPGEHADLLFL
jgi:hypothetical protein